MSFVTFAPNEPSSLDQLIRHWDPKLKMTRSEFVREVSGDGCVLVNAQNVYEHLAATGKSAVPDDGMMPPWNLCSVFWRERLSGPGFRDCVVVVQKAVEDVTADGYEVVGFQVCMYDRVFGDGGSDLSSGPVGAAMIGVLKNSGRIPTDGCIMGMGSQLGIRLAGRFMARTCGGDPADHISAISRYSEATRRANSEMVLTTLAVPLVAFALANCRNVVQRDRGYTSVPARWRESGHPRLRYRVLAIDGRASPQRQGASANTGKRLSLHIVRGHFARYTPEKPLFGKYVGQFWMPQHTRGSADVGTVVKDYAVGPKPN